MRFIKVWGENTYLNVERVKTVSIVESFNDVPNSGKYKLVAYVDGEKKEEPYVIYRNDDHKKCVLALETLTENYNIYDLKTIIESGKGATKKLFE